jgi:dihydroxyacetone kinase-like protein
MRDRAPHGTGDRQHRCTNVQFAGTGARGTLSTTPVDVGGVRLRTGVPVPEEARMKKLINDPHSVVDDTVRGFALAHAGRVVLVEDPIHIHRADAPVPGKVGIVSGGGSGHEPLHAGFVGPGMLDAAVPGPVFTSPTPDPIVDATKAVDGGAGVLHIVKNYTGDVLNFETAAELAGVDDVRVETVVVDDDVAVQDSLYTAGRRGVAGTVVVEKCAGAAAERGDDLDAVAAVARHVNEVTRSMGLALTSGTVPHAGEPSFTLDEDEVELGIGIHGEPGRERIPMAPADQLVDRVLEPILTDLQAPSGSRVLLFVNGMGGTPLSELYIVYRRAAEVLADRGIEVARSLVGDYVTSLEMQGFSITVTVLDDELLALWDAPVDTPALRWGR